MKRMMYDLFKYGPILLVIAFAHSSYASNKPIVCKTHRGAKVFKIVGNRVSINLSNDIESPRMPASLNTKARHKVNAKGVTKVLFFEGNKHLVHVEDTMNPSSLDDYVTITTNQGHAITYPLNCQ